MATNNPRVWFKSISLENVRSFGTKQTIYFTEDGTENGKAARWNVILGDNGTGKTTVLRGLAYSFVENQELVSNRRGIAAYFPRLDDKVSILETLYSHSTKNRDAIQKIIISKNENFTNKKYDLEGLYNWYHEIKPIYLSAYGASRQIGNETITQSEFYSETDAAINAIITLFRDDKKLPNAEEWLVKSEYISFKEENFKSHYRVVLNILQLLFREEVSNIYINTESGTPKVLFKTHYGDVRLHELSLGYRTLIAWMVDFAKGLLDRYPDSKKPLEEPAVCLVDEIDLHLHPKFQRTIIQFLTETFPNTQFIVTAHSPLIVVAAEEHPLDANIILLKREGDQTVVVNEPTDVSKWSVDQILNSDLFGYVPPASEPLTQLRTERDTLLAKAKLTKKEQARLTELDAKIGFVPFGQNQDEINAETIIQQLANVLRSKQSVQ